MTLTTEELQRVNVIGVSGSGKSTFCRRLAGVLEAPCIEMDRLYWGPNWTEPSRDVFRDRLTTAIDQERWVLDGNYDSKTRDLKWPRATAVIWLDMSFPRTIFRSVRRALTRSITREELWPPSGNRESFTRSFLSRDSVVLWTLTSYGRVRRRYADCMDQSGATTAFVRLRSPRDVEAFFRAVADLSDPTSTRP